MISSINPRYFSYTPILKKITEKSLSENTERTEFIFDPVHATQAIAMNAINYLANTLIAILDFFNNTKDLFSSHNVPNLTYTPSYHSQNNNPLNLDQIIIPENNNPLNLDQIIIPENNDFSGSNSQGYFYPRLP